MAFLGCGASCAWVLHWLEDFGLSLAITIEAGTDETRSGSAAGESVAIAENKSERGQQLGVDLVRLTVRLTIMESPKCKLCGKQHWPSAGCSFASKGAEAETGTLPSVSANYASGNKDRGGRQSARHPKTVVVGSSPTGPTSSSGQSKRPTTTAARKDAGKTGVTAGETAQKFDRVAYQREYMRKWRAARRNEPIANSIIKGDEQ